MFNRIIHLTLTACLAGTSTLAMAQAVQWRVTEASGAVFIQHDAHRTAARPGTAIAVGETVVTGVNGRAVLVHNKDFVSVAANSRVRIPQEQAGSTFTRVFQEMGNAVFRIEKLGTPHFAVDTPYLAAVVKGTTFSITVSASDTSLQVIEGLVEVATSDRGARDLVRPGSIAMISATDRYRLTISGDQSRVLDSPARQGGSAVPSPAGALLLPASPTAAAQIQQTSAESRVNSDETSRSNSSQVISASIIDVTISSKPANMSEATGGLVSGHSPVLLAALVTPATASQVLNPSGTGAGQATGQQGVNLDLSKATPVNSASTSTNVAKVSDGLKDGVAAKDQTPGKDTAGASEGKDEAGKNDTPGKGDTAGKGETPGKNDNSAKGDNSGKDDSSDKAGKNDTPGKGDTASKGDTAGEGETPGKNDNSANGDNSGKDDSSAKAGKNDTPGKGDTAGTGETPGKNDNSANGDNSGKDDSSAKAGKNDTPGKGDTAGKGETPGKNDNSGKGDNSAKSDASDKGDSSAKGDNSDKDTGSPKDDNAGKDAKPGKDDTPGKDVPAPKDTPVVKDVPAPKDTPVVMDVPAPKDTPVVKDVPALKDTPVVKDVPAPKDTPVVKDVPAPKDTPVVKDVPAPKDTPGVKDALKVKEIPGKGI